MTNDFYVGIFEDTYLCHNKKGSEKQGHLYTSRYWKNGKWNYVYDNPLNRAMASTVSKVQGSGSPKLKANSTAIDAKLVKSALAAKRNAANKDGQATFSTEKTSSKKSSKKSSGSSSSKSSGKKSSGAKSSKSSGSSKQAKEKTSASGSSAKTENKENQQQQKTVNGNAVKDFSTVNTTDDMMKAINKFGNGTKGYVSVNGLVYLWTKQNGKLAFTTYEDQNTVLDQNTIIEEINKSLAKKKNIISVDKYKK